MRKQRTELSKSLKNKISDFLLHKSQKSHFTSSTLTLSSGAHMTSLEHHGKAPRTLDQEQCFHELGPPPVHLHPRSNTSYLQVLNSFSQPLSCSIDVHFTDPQSVLPPHTVPQKHTDLKHLMTLPTSTP